MVTRQPLILLWHVDTIPGRQCMASCFFLLKQFEDVLIYLNSVKVNCNYILLLLHVPLVNNRVTFSMMTISTLTMHKQKQLLVISKKLRKWVWLA